MAERELLQSLRFQFRGNERFHFQLDSKHPVGACHHQKFVVIDDAMAFSGGIDLSRWRWDTPSHKPDEKGRIDPEGNPYPPFHDLMMAVTGDAAAALGELARSRWQDSGSRVEAVSPSNSHEPAWPDSVDVALKDHTVAISRTCPAFHDQAAVSEVEQLFADSFDAAQEYIYIENQYFTSPVVQSMLADLLQKEEGPEVVLVLPLETGGWLEQATMDALRQDLLLDLLENDAHNRLRVYYAHQSGLDGDCISVHAKVTLIDNRFVRIGSANTSSRSLGVDTECDLSLELDENDDSTAVRDLLHQLLGEHLDQRPEEVAHTHKEKGSLIATIDSLNGNSRCLKKLPLGHKNEHELLPEGELLDPEEPINPDYFMRCFVPNSQKTSSRSGMKLFIMLLVALLAMAAAWRWTPLADWFDADTLSNFLALFDNQALRVLVLILGIALLTLLMLPLSIAVITAGLLLNPWEAFFCSLAGTLLSALVAFQLGQRMRGENLHRFVGGRLHKLSKDLSRRGIIAVAVLRLLPIAPYTIVNLVAGASHLQLLQFILGSLLGLIPGILALTLFSQSLYKALTEPTLTSVGILIAIAFIILAISSAIHKLLGSRRK
jgi:uncharacterized membrane protein YdjX (TVP38/TMEM64 family)